MAGMHGDRLGIPVVVKLESPLGNRELLDPACELDRYGNFVVCERPKMTGLR